MNEKLYTKPLKKYPSIVPFLLLGLFKKTRKPLLRFIKDVFINFFVLQYAQVFKFTKRKVVNVDHPLDSKIPFTPKNVKIYLDFVWFFCRIMSFLIKTLGTKKAIPLCAEIIEFIDGLYNKAGTIYRHALSTTKRPFYIKRPKFVLIHCSDPHLLCVPSLHVAIVVGIWAKMRELLNDKSIDLENREQILNEIYYGSVAITESVLYVKQHSINCIAGALYMLTSSHDEGFFTSKDAKALISKLFINDSLEKSSVKEIQDYIFRMYSELLQKKDQDWAKPLQSWLDNYKGSL